MKASLNKIMVVAVVLLLLPLSTVHNITIKAEKAADGSNIDNTGATSEVVWKNDAQKSVIPISQYYMKIEPRYDIQRWDRYRLFDLHNFFTYRI